MKSLLLELNTTKKNLIYMGIDDKSKVYNKNLVELLEFRNMIDVAILVCESAIKREESRGSHFRMDYPNQKNEYQKNSILIKEDNLIQFKFEEIL
jgi:succinate dehydrogenase / fumarate reductase flavoprotein subunit